MTAVKTDCIVCGECDLTPDDVVLRRRPDRDSYWFIHCNLEQWRTANQKVVDVLLAIGVAAA